jgi:hypothetical protein
MRQSKWLTKAKRIPTNLEYRMLPSSYAFLLSSLLIPLFRLGKLKAGNMRREKHNLASTQLGPSLLVPTRADHYLGVARVFQCLQLQKLGEPLYKFEVKSTRT